MAGRILALDVGDVRIGVAVSDPTGTIAQPLEVYRRVGYGPDSRYVAELLRHLMAYQAGERRDPESGMPHLWHVATNAAFLVALEGESH